MSDIKLQFQSKTETSNLIIAFYSFEYLSIETLNFETSI